MSPPIRFTYSIPKYKQGRELRWLCHNSSLSSRRLLYVQHKIPSFLSPSLSVSCVNNQTFEALLIIRHVIRNRYLVKQYIHHHPPTLISSPKKAKVLTPFLVVLRYKHLKILPLQKLLCSALYNAHKLLNSLD